MLVTVRLSFCEALRPPAGAEGAAVAVDLSPADTVAGAKAKIAAALGGRVAPAMLLLHFGPVDAVIGASYAGDPGVDEAGVTLGQYSALSWIARFPAWPLGVRPLPPAPPPPGVAAHTAAALAEGKDPEAAVAAARAQGEIPALSSLPAPWGPRPGKRDPARAPKTWPTPPSVDVGGVVAAK